MKFGNGSATLAEIVRSNEIESTHRGNIAVASARGELIAFAGDPRQPVYWRSAAKLHQALPLVLAGGLDRLRLTDAELAIICASHNGEPEQIRCVESVLRKIGLAPDALRCGLQEPYGVEAARDLIRRGVPPSPLHNTCSGNHAGLLALTKLLGAPTAGYEPLSHPAQQRALSVVAQFAGMNIHEIHTGVDGCGIPAYRTPLAALAIAFARLVAPPPDWNADLRSAAAVVVRAVTSHPDQLSGRGELDTELMRAFGGGAVCKLGAEAVCAAAFRPTERFPDGLGLALKIEDGLGHRARSVALLECLDQLELGTESQRAAFRSQIDVTVKTRRGKVVGEVRPAFRLELSD